MVRDWLRRWHRFASWLNCTETPPLADDEQQVFESGAGLIGYLPIQGILVLTTKRLFYMPGYFRFNPFQLRIFHFLPGLYAPKPERVEIPLSDIQALGSRSWFRGLYGGFPGLPIFTIRLRDGRHYAFQTIGPKYVKEEIEHLRRQLCDLE